MKKAKDWDYWRLQWDIMEAHFAGNFERERALLAKQEEYR